MKPFTINFTGSQIKQAIDRFFFTASNSRVLAFFRISVACIAGAHMLAVYQDILNLYGKYGYVRSEIIEALSSTYMPRISWVTDLLMQYGWSEKASIDLLIISYIVALVLLALGCATRFSAVVAWLIHLLFLGSGRIFSYGADDFTSIALFYCMIMPVGYYFSIDSLWSRRPKPANQSIGFFIRLLQVHVCIIYFVSGFCKSLGYHWWNGEAIWRATMLPTLKQMDMSWMAHVPWLPMVIGWSVLLFELGYPLLISHRYTRGICVMSVVAMHLGIAIFMGLTFFAAIMIVLNVSAFGWPYLSKLYESTWLSQIKSVARRKVPGYQS